MKRSTLLAAALFASACAAEPSLFDVDEDSTAGETDDVGDGEAARIAWIHELPGYALGAEIDGDGAVFMVRPYELGMQLHRIADAGQALDVIDLPAAAADFTWGEDVTLVENQQYDGYRIRTLGEQASETMPGWGDEIQRGVDGGLRVVGVAYAEEQPHVYLDIYAPDGTLTASWTQPQDHSIWAAQFLDDGTSETHVVWVSRGDDRTNVTTGTISRVGIDGTMLATRTIDFAGALVREPVPHPEGWMIVGTDPFGMWTQIVPADLGVPGPRVFDETAAGKWLASVVGLEDGVLAIVGEADVPQLEARRYDLDGALVGTTSLPLIEPAALGQVSYVSVRNGDAVFIAGVDFGSGSDQEIGWVTRLDL